jgi:hypothetical protein
MVSPLLVVDTPELGEESDSSITVKVLDDHGELGTAFMPLNDL